MASARSRSKTVADDGLRAARPPLRAAQREFTRQVLIDAAVETFERNGYTNTTIDDIVKRAHATRGTFYQYFTSKRDIVNALLDGVVEQADEYFATLESAQPLTRKSVRNWLGAVAEFLIDNRTVIKAFYDAAAGDPELARKVAEIQRRFIAMYEPHLKRDRRHSSNVRAHLLEAQRERIMWWWIVEGWDLDGDEVLDALTDVWVDALGVGHDAQKQRSR